MRDLFGWQEGQNLLRPCCCCARLGCAVLCSAVLGWAVLGCAVLGWAGLPKSSSPPLFSSIFIPAVSACHCVPTACCPTSHCRREHNGPDGHHRNTRHRCQQQQQQQHPRHHHAVRLARLIQAQQQAVPHQVSWQAARRGFLQPHVYSSDAALAVAAPAGGWAAGMPVSAWLPPPALPAVRTLHLLPLLLLECGALPCGSGGACRHSTMSSGQRWTTACASPPPAPLPPACAWFALVPR